MRLNNKFLASAAILLSGTFAQAANVRTDYDHQANFADYKTFSFGNVKTSNPLNEDRVKADITKELQADGWQMVASGGKASVFVHDSVKNEQELETMYDGLGGGWGGGWGWGGWGAWGGGWGPGGFGESTTTSENQRVGHIVLDIFDASNHKLLFRGVSDSDLSNNSNKNAKNLAKDINDILKKLPKSAK